jgi:hypothetical protein
MLKNKIEKNQLKKDRKYRVIRVKLPNLDHENKIIQ